MKRILLLLLIIFSNQLIAQKPIHEWYSQGATELIFSSGKVEGDIRSLTTGEVITFSPVVRFSAFLHIQFQSHYNFSENFGLYTGLGSRNVGLINHFDYKGDQVSLKQRSYSLGIPLAFKLGNMVTNKFIAFGAEVEWMFAYKKKVLYKDNKSKEDAWFSGDVNPINPSVFAEIHFSKHGYIKGKYYLMDFLANREMNFYLPSAPDQIYYKPSSSTMWYISIGTTWLNPKKKHATKTTV